MSETFVKKTLRFLSATQNRGFLMDCFVFLLNLGAMSLLTRAFVGVVRKSAEGYSTSNSLLFGMAVALFVLAPVGAILKRWHHHKDRTAGTKDDDVTGGCLFNPIFYFCLTAVIFSTVNAFILERVYGRKEPNGDVFITSIFAGIALMILHTVLVYRYFSPPKSAPRSAFLRGQLSNGLGDVCLFANMILFQLLWNLLSLVPFPHPTGGFDVVSRSLLLMFLALMLYFPPRMFYLADDIHKKRTWLIILLANAPLLIRVLVGTEPAVRW